MTLDEIKRAIDSWSRRKKLEAQELAINNYILASLVARNIAATFSNDVEIPKVEQIYSSLFEDQAKETQEKQENLKAELSAARFKQFADFHNKKFKNQEVAKAE